jgi:hypothetical protein
MSPEQHVAVLGQAAGAALVLVVFVIAWALMRK